MSSRPMGALQIEIIGFADRNVLRPKVMSPYTVMDAVTTFRDL